MLAIVLDENQHSRQVLCQMLKRLGYSQTLECVDLRDFDLQCSQRGKKVRLIISGLQQEDGLDFPLSRMVIQNPDLNLVPLIFMTNRGFKLRAPFLKSRFSRIDSYLHRPFAGASLKNAIVRAYERRAEFRNVILILQTENDSDAIEASYASPQNSHWKETIFVHSLAELEEKSIAYGFRVGGFILDEHHLNPEIREWVKKMRRSIIGATSIISVIGRNSENIALLREDANFFFKVDTEWEEILTQMSCRLRRDWEAKRILRKIRNALKEQNFAHAKTLLKGCDKRNLLHWEIEEQRALVALASQRVKQAVFHFFRALEINPVAPSLYIKLIPTLSKLEQKQWILQARQYCPSHPEILEIHESLL